MPSLPKNYRHNLYDILADLVWKFPLRSMIFFKLWLMLMAARLCGGRQSLTPWIMLQNQSNLNIIPLHSCIRIRKAAVHYNMASASIVMMLAFGSSAELTCNHQNCGGGDIPWANPLPSFSPTTIDGCAAACLNVTGVLHIHLTNCTALHTTNKNTYTHDTNNRQPL